MNGSANIEVLDRLREAVARDDLPAALECLDSDLEWVPLRAATEGAYHGHAGFEQFLIDTRETFETFEPNLELEDFGGGRVLALGAITVRGKGQRDRARGSDRWHL
jgi:hypothetical protein